jgi:hypothetical protein
VLQIAPGERDALRLIGEGRRRCEVAACLEVPECQLDSRLAALFERMGVTSELEAVAESVKRGLCERQLLTPAVRRRASAETVRSHSAAKSFKTPPDVCG